MILKDILFLSDSEALITYGMLSNENVADGRPAALDIPEGTFLIDDAAAIDFIQEFENRAAPKLLPLRFAHRLPAEIGVDLLEKSPASLAGYCIRGVSQLYDSLKYEGSLQNVDAVFNEAGFDVSDAYDVAEYCSIVETSPGEPLNSDEQYALGRLLQKALDFSVLGDALVVAETMSGRNIYYYDKTDLNGQKEMHKRPVERRDLIAALRVLNEIADLKKLLSGFDPILVEHLVPAVGDLSQLRDDLMTGALLMVVEPKAMDSTQGAAYVPPMDTLYFREPFGRIALDEIRPDQEELGFRFRSQHGIHELVHATQDKKGHYRPLEELEGEAYAIGMLYTVLKYGEESTRKVQESHVTAHDDPVSLVLLKLMGEDFAIRIPTPAMEEFYWKTAMDWAVTTHDRLKTGIPKEPVPSASVGEAWLNFTAAFTFLKSFVELIERSEVADVVHMLRNGGKQAFPTIIIVGRDPASFGIIVKRQNFVLPDDAAAIGTSLEASGVILQHMWQDMCNHPAYRSYFGSTMESVQLVLKVMTLAAITTRAANPNFNTVKFYDAAILPLLKTQVSMGVGSDKMLGLNGGSTFIK